MNILIIGPSWVGDSVMAQSLYIQLKKEDPDCNIDVVSPPWTVSIMERMPQVSRNIVSPFLHGDIKLISRNRFGKSLKKFNYDRSIILTNSFKSALVPYFAKIPIRTGWLGEFRYGLLNDIRKLDPTKNHLMVEKFVSLSLQDNNYSLDSLDFPSLIIDLVNFVKPGHIKVIGLVHLVSICNRSDPKCPTSIKYRSYFHIHNTR